MWVAGWGHPAVQVEGASPDPPAVGVSRDGGKTWVSVCWPDGWPPNGAGRAVAFRSSLGFIVGSFYDRTFVLRTADAGTTWQTVTLPDAAQPSGGANCGQADAAIIDDHNVWLVAAGGIYHSGDAGRSFTRQAVPNDGPCAFGRLAFADAAHVWATGSNRVVRTADGGTTWTDSNQPLPVPAYAALNDVFFTDAAHGFIATSDSVDNTPRGLLFATDDGGQTWRKALETPGILRSVDFVDHDHGFVAGGTPARGEVWATIDGGQTWERRAALDSRDIQVISFIDRERGYGTISNRPCIIATTDGGHTWTKIPVAGPTPHPCEPDG